MSLAWLAGAGTAAAEARYHLERLEVPADVGSHFMATSLNNAGQVGGSYTPTGVTVGTYARSAILNTGSGEFWDLGDAFGWGNSNRVVSLNDDAHVVIEADTGVVLFKDGTVTPLNLLAGPRRINNLDQVAGLAYFDDGTHAVVATATGNQDLGIPAGMNESAASAVNNAGQAVGFAARTEPCPDRPGTCNEGFAYLYANGTAVQLAPGAANDINIEGAAVGHLRVGPYQTTQPEIDHAFFFDGQTVHDLGTLQGGNSYAYALNSSNVVVGTSVTRVGPGSRAFVWSHGVMEELDTLTDAPDVRLDGAFAINSSGQILCEGPLGTGEIAYYLLTPIP